MDTTGGNIEQFNIASFTNKVEKIVDSFETDDQGNITDSLVQLLSSVPETVLEKVGTQIIKKDSLTRFKKHAELLLMCIKDSSFEREGVSYEEATNDAYKIYLHCLDLWLDSTKLFLIDSFPSATFLAIVCVEESSKVIVQCFKLLSYQGKGPNLNSSNNNNPQGKNKGPLFSHPIKHLLAGMSGLLVNSRADRNLGMQNIINFLNLIENKQLEAFRQSCVYADVKNNKLITPKDIHNAKTSALYISIAGEIIAESFFTNPDSGFISDLNTFEKKFLNTK